MDFIKSTKAVRDDFKGVRPVRVAAARSWAPIGNQPLSHGAGTCSQGSALGVWSHAKVIADSPSLQWNRT